MTRIELADALDNAKMTLESARFLMQEISEEYFENYDPDFEKGKFAIVYNFERYRAFSRILKDLLARVDYGLPDSDCMEAMTQEEATT